MDDKKVTPIRPGVSVKSKPKKLSRGQREEARIKDRLHDFQFRVGRAAALARSMALALEHAGVGVITFEIEATEGCLGVAELLDGIRDEMYNLSQA